VTSPVASRVELLFVTSRLDTLSTPPDRTPASAAWPRRTPLTDRSEPVRPMSADSVFRVPAARIRPSSTPSRGSLAVKSDAVTPARSMTRSIPGSGSRSGKRRNSRMSPRAVTREPLL